MLSISKIKSLRLVSAFVLVAMLCQDLAYANPKIKSHLIQPLFSPKPIPIPENIARLDDFWFASASSMPRNDGLMVYLIQDAHTNLSAQMNIARALEILIQKEKIKTVYLEGGFGDVSLNFLKPQSKAEKRQDVGKRYLRTGEISGAEYLNLISNADFGLWGVEDEKLYWDSLEIYRSIVKDRERFKNYLSRVKRSAEELKPEILNPMLRTFDSFREKFLDGAISFTEYFDLLSRRAGWFEVSMKPYPEFRRLKRLKHLEKQIDFSKANEEALRAIRTLPPEKLKELNEVSSGHEVAKFSLKNQKTERVFYLALETVMARSLKGDEAISAAEIASGTSSPRNDGLHPNLLNYFKYLHEVGKMDFSKLLNEQKSLEEAVVRTLLQTEDEKQMLEVSDAVRDLDALLDLTLLPDAYQKINRHQASYDIEKITGFLNRKIMDLEDHYDRALFLENDFDKTVQKAKEFYRLTEERDRVFLSRMTEKMRARGKKFSRNSRPGWIALMARCGSRRLRRFAGSRRRTRSGFRG